MRLPNGYGSIINLGKKRRRPFAVRITVGWSKEKRQLYKYIGYFEKRTEALECLIDYNKSPYDIAQRQLTLNEVWELWSERHFDKVAKNSIRAYKIAYKKLEPIYNFKFNELRAVHFQKIIDEYVKAGASTSTVRQVKNVAALLYDFAIKNEIATKDYSKLLDLPKKSTARDNKPFTIDEISTLKQQQGNIYADILLILLYTGMRITELLEMQTANINLNERYMRGGIKTSNGKNRVIPIHKDILPIIEKRLDSKYLFMTKRGYQCVYSNISTKITKYMRNLGFNHIIHETRHTFITQASRLDIDKLTLKLIVGHSSSDITHHYTHKNIDDLVKAIDNFYY